MPMTELLHQRCNAAFPSQVILVGTCLPNGCAQIIRRGSVQSYDDDHISFWDRGGGSTAAGLIDGSKVTIYFHNPELMPAGVLPAGGIARFYGEAAIHKDDPIAQRIWDRLEIGRAHV